MVVLDTNIIIDHLRSSASRQTALMALVEVYPRESLALSVISIQELYEGKSTLQTEKEKDLLLTVTSLRMLPYTYEVAKIAGSISRDLTEPIELADAAIAATAIINNAQLFTLNKKDFQNIAGLELLE